MRVYPGLLRKRLSIAWYCNICAFGRVGFGHPIVKCQATTQDGCNSPERCTLPGSTQQRILVVLLKTSQTVVQHPLGNAATSAGLVCCWRFPIFWVLGRGMLTRHHAFDHLTAQISPGMNALGVAGGGYGHLMLSGP